MKTPIKISFKKKVKGLSSSEIIEDFKENFSRHNFDNIEVIDKNKLIVTNKLFSFKRGFSSSFLTSTEKAELEIVNNKVSYTIYFTRLFLTLVFSWILFSFFDLIVENETDSYISSFMTFGLIFLSIGILILMLLFLEHRAFFRRTLKYGGGFLKYYDWNSIIKKMTDYKLHEIVNGKTHQPRKIIVLAEDELKSRKTEDK